MYLAVSAILVQGVQKDWFEVIAALRTLRTLKKELDNGQPHLWQFRSFGIEKAV
jgi:hypothetical protein